MHFKNLTLTVTLAFAAMSGNAFAVGNFTETFNTNASNWLNGSSAAPTYNATGGIDDTGYISFTYSGSTAASSSFPGSPPPTQVMFRANDAANASGDAFVGNWISSGVTTLSVSVRHNYVTDLNFYLRVAAPTPAGAGASLAFQEDFVIAPNVWTTIIVPIVDSPSSFLSYGPSTFNGVFSNVNNMQLGLYLPPNTEITNLTMGIDNVTLTVPEPTSGLLLGLGLAVVALRRRTRPH